MSLTIGGTTFNNPFSSPTTFGTQASTAVTALSGDSTDIGSIGGMVGHSLGGGVASFFSASKVVSAFHVSKAGASASAAASAADAGTKVGLATKMTGGVKGILGGFKAALPAIGKGTLIGTAVSAVVSAGINGYRAASGQITGKQALGEVAADTVTGAASSLGGLAVGAAVVGIAGTMLGGLPLTILGIGAGIVGGLLTDRLTSALGIHKAISDAIGGGTTTTTSTPTPTPTPTPAPGGNF